MSWATNEWVRKSRVGDPVLKFLLLVLSNRANADGELWPSQKLLAWDSEIPERSVRRKLKELADMGLIEMVPRVKPDGTKGTNMIRLLFDPAATVAGGDEPRTPTNTTSGQTDQRPKKGVTSGQKRGSPAATYVAGHESSRIVRNSKLICGTDLMDGSGDQIDLGTVYDQLFKPIYPKRDGGLDAATGRKKFITICNKGVSPDVIVAGAQRYAAWAKSAGKTGTQFIAQIPTWLNNNRWEEDYSIDPRAPRGNGQRGPSFNDIADQIEGRNRDE